MRAPERSTLRRLRGDTRGEASLGRDRVLVGIAVLSVVGALAMVLGAVLRGNVAPASTDTSEGFAASRVALDRAAGRGSSAVEPVERAESSGDVAPAHAQPWAPTELPEEDVSGGPPANGEGAAAALKKCCDSLRAGPKRVLGHASEACDRVFATISSRSGPASDTLASAALGMVRETIARQPKASSAPAACK